MSTESRRQVFLSIATKKLVPDNSFRNFCVKDAALGKNAQTVTIPHAGGAITGGTGRANLSASHNDSATILTVKVFKGTKTTYSAEVFYTDPYVIENQDGKELTYSKREAVVTGHTDYLHTRFADYTASGWTPAYAATTAGANLVETTGTGTRTSIVVGGYAGLVKKITKDDIVKVKAKFMKMNLPASSNGKLYALITPEMWEDLLNIDEFARYDSLGITSQLLDGELKTVLGINWIIRQNDAAEANVVLREDSAEYTKIAFDAALANTDVSAALFWNSAFVRGAEGGLDAFFTPKDGQARGDILNFEGRRAATIWRNDEAGVVCLVEKKTA